MSKFIHSPELSEKSFAEFVRLLGERRAKGWSNSSFRNDSTDSLTFMAPCPEQDDEMTAVAVLHLPDSEDYREFYYYELDCNVEGTFKTIEETAKFITSRGLHKLL